MDLLDVHILGLQIICKIWRHSPFKAVYKDYTDEVLGSLKVANKREQKGGERPSFQDLIIKFDHQVCIGGCHCVQRKGRVVSNL